MSLSRAVSYATLRTITRLCHSADPALTGHHVPRLRSRKDAGHHRELTALVMPFAHNAWVDLQNPDAGSMRFDRDHYLKIWALTQPRIPADFLLLDEAQDTDRVVEQVFNAQRDHAQPVMVGDSTQAIYR
ncbi:UvrD-helicase domain-containing protein [Streptomyces sp. NPDC059611]|uniref:UvrD-helicase domain-containing protein n=1 Tax=Streptomyces sp. NPDC059611 TaxID=3346884 RepID=UPI0036A53505